MANHSDPATKTPAPQPPPTAEDARAKLDALLAAAAKERAAIAEETAAIRALIQREQSLRELAASERLRADSAPLLIPCAIVRATGGAHVPPRRDAEGAA